MLYLVLLVLSICCIVGGLGLRNIGNAVANFTFISNGVLVETPRELVEYGMNFVTAGTIILAVGVVGFAYLIFRTYKDRNNGK